MRSRVAACAALLSLVTSVDARAVPVNHVLGDAGFVWRHGRLPTRADAELERIGAHLDLVGRLHRARPTDDLPAAEAARRHALLDVLADYRRREAYPVNHSGRDRTPVFVDEVGNICAVGRLVEASAGRDLAEGIAARFNLDHLEDMDWAPLAEWVATSGFTAEELAMIQPGYMRWMDLEWGSYLFDPPEQLGIADGPTRLERGDGSWLEGAFRDGHLDGAWVRYDADGQASGYGLFDRGAGVWLTWDVATGELLAQGHYRDSAPDGAWRFFWPDGRVRAEGHFAGGLARGHWRYWSVEGRLLADGPRAHNEVGRWRFYDAAGAVSAIIDFDRWQRVTFDRTQRLVETRDLSGVWSVEWDLHGRLSVITAGPRSLGDSWRAVFDAGELVAFLFEESAEAECRVNAVMAWVDRTLVASGTIATLDQSERPCLLARGLRGTHRPAPTRSAVNAWLEASFVRDSQGVVSLSDLRALVMPEALRPPTGPVEYGDKADSLELPWLFPQLWEDRREGPFGHTWDLDEVVAPCAIELGRHGEPKALTGARPCDVIAFKHLDSWRPFDLVLHFEYPAELIAASVNPDSGGWDGFPPVELATDFVRTQMLDRFRCSQGLVASGPGWDQAWRCRGPQDHAEPLFGTWLPDRVVSSLGDPSVERYSTTYRRAR